MSEESTAEKRYALKRHVLLRVVLGVAVAIAALVVWRMRYSKTSIVDGGESSTELKHVEIDYEKFLENEQVLLQFTEDVFISLKLAKAYPQGKDIKFRFDGLLNIRDQKKRCELIVFSNPRISNENVELSDWRFESFDVEDLADEDAKRFINTGDSVFAIFLHKVKSVPLPLFFKAKEIVQMTSAEIVVR